MSEKKTLRPARLDVRDMPVDKLRFAASFRRSLAAIFNYCRQYPTKMAYLKKLLKYALDRIETYEEQQAEFAKELAERKAKAAAKKTEGDTNTDEDEAEIKDKLEAKGREYGLELDKRKSVEDLKAELVQFVQDLTTLGELSEEEREAIKQLNKAGE